MQNIVNALLLKEGAVLLARRAPHRKAYPGLWSFPGGHVEEGETLEQALVREAREEFGIELIKYSILSNIIDPNSEIEFIKYHMFTVTKWDGQPHIADDEHTEFGWFPLERAMTLSDLALEEYRQMLDFLRSGTV